MSEASERKAPVAPAGALVLVGTPIGNLEDMSPRAIRAIAEADVVACEDTRRTGALLNHLGLHKKMVPYHDHNQEEAGPKLMALLASGKRLVLVSDAGMPGLADPGERLVALAHAEGRPVVVVPGPSSAIAALVASGLPAGRFAFEGFLPRDGTKRRRRLRELLTERRTMVFFEGPHRAADCLTDLAAAFGPERPATVARELTKLHEELRLGTLGELAAAYEAEAPRGELVLIVGGASEAEIPPPDPLAWRAELARRLADGESTASAAKAVAKAHGLRKAEVYAQAIGQGLDEGAPEEA